MKWSDIFKKLGINMDDEIDSTSKETLDVEKKVIEIKNDKEGVDTKDSGKDTKKDVPTAEEKEDTKMGFKAPKVDKKGFYDLTNIEDEDMKAFFKERNDARKVELATRKAEDDKRAVNDAISKYASGVKFADGWSVDDALKLGDFSKVVNDENMSKEIENAFTNLKASKAGMFVADKDTKNVQKNVRSNPMLEGFNPVSAEKSTAMTEDEIIAMAYGSAE